MRFEYKKIAFPMIIFHFLYCLYHLLLKKTIILYFDWDFPDFFI